MFTIVLGFEGSHVGNLVGEAYSVDRAQLIGRMCRRRGETKVRIDLVQESEVDLGIGGCRNRGKQRTRRIRGTDVEALQTARRTRQGIGRIGTHLESSGQAHASRGTHLGHFHDIKNTRRVQATLGIIHTQVRSLASLERELDIVRHLEGGFQNARTITLQLSLVKAKLVKGILGSNLGRKSTGFVLFRFNGECHGSGTLFGLEDKLSRKVVRQKIIRTLGDIGKLGSHGER
mmetsp:Transcript_9305/g.18746  ORF Transcript_9305/g.18746 Transcript_9305/m.18746 type:complete len:232 (+) Transcript_9305:219-914(+)